MEAIIHQRANVWDGPLPTADLRAPKREPPSDSEFDHTPLKRFCKEEEEQVPVRLWTSESSQTAKNESIKEESSDVSVGARIDALIKEKVDREFPCSDNVSVCTQDKALIKKDKDSVVPFNSEVSVKEEASIKEEEDSHGAFSFTSKVPRGQLIPAQNVNGQNDVQQPGTIEVTLEPDTTETDDAISGEEEGEEEQEGNKGAAGSDEDWVPQTATEEGNEDMKNTSSEEDEEGEEVTDNKTYSHKKKNKQLCTECGSFHYGQDHTCEHKSKPYPCRVCGKRFITELFLQAHSNQHNEKHDYFCKYCYATFKTRREKSSHEEIHLNENNPFKCKDCTSTFPSHKERLMHMKNHREKKYKCDHCEFSFWSKDNLKKHMMIHKGGTPYKCSLCDRGFNQASNLKSHMRHQHIKLKTFQCLECDQSFSYKAGLKSHVKRHHK